MFYCTYAMFSRSPVSTASALRARQPPTNGGGQKQSHPPPAPLTFFSRFFMVLFPLFSGLIPASPCLMYISRPVSVGVPVQPVLQRGRELYPIFLFVPDLLESKLRM